MNASPEAEYDQTHTRGEATEAQLERDESIGWLGPLRDASESR